MSSPVQTFIFGATATELPILAYRFQQSRADEPSQAGGPPPRALILGGVHGDEIEGVWAAQGLLKKMLEQFPFRLQVDIVPTFNLDGVLARERRNSRGVDLNRNLPSKDWTSEVATERYFPGPSSCSEPENQALVSYLSAVRPDFILSLHSWKPMLNINGDCLQEAQVIASRTGYVIEPSIGYPTPGCLGTYAALENGIPTLTYEIERGLDQGSILRLHVPAILAALRATEKRKAQK